MMRNLKKLVWAIVLVMIISTVYVCADETDSFVHQEEAQKLNYIGLYKGISSNTFNPDLGTQLDRETGVVMLLRLFGLDSEAERLEDDDMILSGFIDASEVSSWARKSVAYAVKNGIIKGTTSNTIGPKALLNGKAYCTMILRQLGYSPDYNNAPLELAALGGLTETDAQELTNKALIKDDLVGISFKVLSISDSNGIKAIENLIENGVVERDKAIELGLIDEVAVEAEDLDVLSAVPLNDRLLEVSLKTAPQSELMPGSISIKDKDGNIVTVSKIEFAGWDSNKKTLLVWLDAATSSEKAYTLESGDSKVFFGGKGRDTGKPKVVNVYSAGNKSIIVEFNSPVRLEGGVFTVVEKSGDKLPLAVTAISYKKKNAILLTTEEQKETSVYSITIEGVSDFSGNVMDKDEGRVFAGTKKVQNILEMTNAKAIEYNKVVIEFNYDLDEATIPDAIFTITERSSLGTQFPVLSVEKATKEDSYGGTDASAARSVVVTVEGNLKGGVIYKAEVGGGIMGLYEKTLSIDQDKLWKLFGGIGKPLTYLDYASPATTTDSGTSITVRFNRKVEKSLAENVANYTITQGSSASLSVIAAELQPNGTDVKLTVAPMKFLIYHLKVKGITDIYGNPIKEEEIIFAGMEPASKISAIKSIERLSGSVIRVEFDKFLGPNALDVSLYSIDNGIGHPEAISFTNSSVVNYKAKVDIIIPDTVPGKVYTLTVRGLCNSDGVYMDSGDMVQGVFGGMLAD